MQDQVLVLIQTLRHHLVREISNYLTFLLCVVILQIIHLEIKKKLDINNSKLTMVMCKVNKKIARFLVR